MRRFVLRTTAAAAIAVAGVAGVPGAAGAETAACGGTGQPACPPPPSCPPLPRCPRPASPFRLTIAMVDHALIIEIDLSALDPDSDSELIAARFERIRGAS